jgi:hypothetical protein
MTLFPFVALCLLLFGNPLRADNFVDENDFAEFEDDVPATTTKPNVREEYVEERKPIKEAPVKTEDDEDGFVQISDDDDFESFEGRQMDDENEEKKPLEIKPLTFSDIPSHFRSNWSSYQVEAVALVFIFIYVANYLYGKTRNHGIAVGWFLRNRSLMEQNFALVGDDGVSQEAETGHLMKDTDYSYSIWSTGRAGCIGMLTQIKLNKRQDFVAMTLNIFKPKLDRVVHKIDLDHNEMDAFVLIFGLRKNVSKCFKELTDLSTYAVERKGVEKFGLPASFGIYAEISETTLSLIDTSVVQFIKKYEKYIDYFHFSDQYSGAKPQEENFSRLPDTSPTLIFSYNLFDDADEEVDHALMSFTFFMVERLRRYRLSKEGKNKSDKKRQSVEETFLKTTHQQRQEAAQARREEKTRERKQRLLEEEDPEKQKRLEKLEMKREKRNGPKMKQLKIK